MGLGGVTIAALHAVMCLEVPFSDGLGGNSPLNTRHVGISLHKFFPLLILFLSIFLAGCSKESDRIPDLTRTASPDSTSVDGNAFSLSMDTTWEEPLNVRF